MAKERRAVIDVGTNSIKLLVADVEGRTLEPWREASRQTRLGRGFYETRQLRPEAIRQSADAVEKFAATARADGARSVRVIATSAARDALNASELVAALERAAGAPVEIISGEQEAEWAFQGVTTDPALANLGLIIMDVGGGSTEFVAAHRASPHVRHSFPLGTVRLMEAIPHSEPPAPAELEQCRRWVRDFLQSQVGPVIEPLLIAGSGGADWHRETTLIGTGGTATILGRMEARLDSYDRARLDGLSLGVERLRWHVRQLWSLPVAQRKAIVGLPASRADVILTGAVIYEGVMETFGLAALRVSTRGLRWAALLA